MLKREHYIEDIKNQIAIFQNKIELETILNHHNLKLYGENFFRDILNIIYPKANFKNTNFLESNFPAIDLISDETKKCIQITSNRTRDKIKDTINAYKKSDEYSDYDIEIYYLLEKAKPNNIKDLEKELNIEDLSSKLKDSRDLMKSIDNLEVEELERVWKLFKINDESIHFLPKLKEKYLNNFSTISLLINDTQKNIEDIFINLAIIKEKKETKQDKNLIVRESLLNSYEEIYKPKEPIEIKELINKAKKSLVYGKAGVGKTTLCKYIAYKWAKGEIYSEFEYVIYISLRAWKDKGLKGAIKDNYYSQDEDNISFDIKGNANKILFLFDGYDELKGDKKKTLISEIAYYGLTHYIITTRPYGYQRNDFRVDEHFETIGFTYENVKEYIEIFFKDNSDKSKSLKKFLQSNIGIKHIAYIPLMLEMICTLWQEKEFSDSLTMTELYSAVVENMLQKHSDKNRDDETVSEWENREDIKELLGKIAFYSLTKQNILFDGKFIRDTIGKNNLDFFKVSIVNSGFLKSDVKDKSLLGNNFEFLHLTFQEYFSALYVASLSKDEQSEIIRDWKFYPHMQVFFAFLGGLIKDKEFLIMSIKHKPKDLLGLYSLSLLADCLSQIKDSYIKINNEMIKWFLFIIKSSINEKIYYQLLLKIKGNQYFHNEKILNMLISLIEEDNDCICKYDIVHIILYVGKDIDNFINILIKRIIKNPKFSDFFQNKISSHYDIFHDDSKFISTLIKNIHHEKNQKYKENMFLVLASIEKNDDYIIDIILKYLEGRREYLNYNESTLFNIFGALGETIYSSSSSNSLSYKIRYKDILKNINNSYSKIEEKSKYKIDYREILENIDFVHSPFTKKYIGEFKFNAEDKDLKKINTLFKAYDNNLDISKELISNLIHSNKPIYIKNNKLCTIEDGKEICTKIDVNNEILNKLNSLKTNKRIYL